MILAVQVSFAGPVGAAIYLMKGQQNIEYLEILEHYLVGTVND